MRCATCHLIAMLKSRCTNRSSRQQSLGCSCSAEPFLEAFCCRGKCFSDSTAGSVVTALRHSLLLIVYLLGLPALAAAAESCAQGMGTVCLDAVQSGSSVSISADNHETYDVTVTVNAVLDNMTASVKLPYTRS